MKKMLFCAAVLCSVLAVQADPLIQWISDNAVGGSENVVDVNGQPIPQSSDWLVELVDSGTDEVLGSTTAGFLAGAGLFIETPDGSGWNGQNVKTVIYSSSVKTSAVFSAEFNASTSMVWSAVPTAPPVFLYNAGGVQASDWSVMGTYSNNIWLTGGSGGLVTLASNWALGVPNNTDNPGILNSGDAATYADRYDLAGKQITFNGNATLSGGELRPANAVLSFNDTSGLNLGSSSLKLWGGTTLDLNDSSTLNTRIFCCYSSGNNVVNHNTDATIEVDRYVGWDQDSGNVYNLAAGKISASASYGGFNITSGNYFNFSSESTGIMEVRDGNHVAELTGFVTNGLIRIDDGVVDATYFNIAYDGTNTTLAAKPIFTLTYSAGDHGSLSGNASQQVPQGEDGSAITAVPDQDYYFSGWSDGSTDNPRMDTNITANLSVTANFESVYPASDSAESQSTSYGAVSGTLNDILSNDDVYEALSEEQDVSPTSLLEHEWTFDVYGSELVTFYVEAHHTVNSEGDDFVFAYSTNGTDWVDMVTVTKTADDDTAQYYALPSELSGTVYVRVTDADRTVGNTSLDTLYVDALFIVSDQPSTAPTAASNPSPGNGASDVAVDAVLDWAAGAQAAAHEVYFGTNLVYQGRQSFVGFDPGSLAYDTTYYWAIDEANSLGTTTGALWSFTTIAAPNQPPVFSVNPFSKANATVDVAYSASIADDAYDPESDLMTFSKVSGRDWLSVASDGALSGTPGSEDVGLQSFIVQVDAAGGSDTATLNIVVDAAPAVPAAPSNLSASAIATTQIDLSWTDNADNETGFKVERSWRTNGSYEEIATVGTDITSFNDTTVSKGSTYFYRVRAANAVGDSPYSNEANATTPKKQ